MRGKSFKKEEKDNTEEHVNTNKIPVYKSLCQLYQDL